MPGSDESRAGAAPLSYPDAEVRHEDAVVPAARPDAVPGDPPPRGADPGRTARSAARAVADDHAPHQSSPER
ncbi:hypothetical protein [Streptomyces sp. NPDC003667]